MDKHLPKSLILVPPLHLGDTVLLEPILRYLLGNGCLADVDSPYRSVFDKQGWARVEKPEGVRRIDLTGPWEDGNRVLQYQEQLSSMGIPMELVMTRPRLDNIVPAMGKATVKRLGIFHGAGELWKVWPYWKLAAEHLQKRGQFEIHCFDKYLSLGVGIEYTGLSLQETMSLIASMDVVVGNDTGLAHIAAALGIPTVVVCGLSDGESLYAPYVEFVKVIQEDAGLECLPVRRFLAEAIPFINGNHISLEQANVVGEPYRRVAIAKSRDIALMRLDGMGGTITLLDQATKVHQATGKRVVLITRGFEPLLSHHAVRKVRNLGGVDWLEATRCLHGSYHAFADIRLAAGKWYGKTLFRGTHEFDKYYEWFPHGMVEMEKYGKHQVQLADDSLGLPSDTIETFLEVEGEIPKDIPLSYILVSTGTDRWHQGKYQTKTWPWWNKVEWKSIKSGFPSPIKDFGDDVSPIKDVGDRSPIKDFGDDVLGLDVIQVGSCFDPPIDGAIDLRRKTSLLELVGLVRMAEAIVCTEGGLMHLAYSCKHPRAIVLRGPTRGKLFEYPGLHYVDAHVCSPCWSKTSGWAWECPEGIDAACMQSITHERVRYNLEALVA